MFQRLRKWWKGEYVPSTLDHALHGGPGEGHFKQPRWALLLKSIYGFVRGDQNRRWHETAIGKVFISVVSSILVAFVIRALWP